METKLIVFDFDGTLADTSAGILATYKSTAERLHIKQHTDDEYRKTIGVPLREGFRMLYGDFDDKELDKCVDTYRSIYVENKGIYVPSLYPDVKKTLEALFQRGVAMTVASSRSHASLIELCEALGITKYFSAILGAEDVARPKPAPDPVIMILKHYVCDEANAMVVGDMPVDIAMGLGAGCRTVGVTYGNSTREKLAEAEATYIIDRFSDLKELAGITRDAD